jgi:quercetin 2,3-dioxygenase
MKQRRLVSIQNSRPTSDGAGVKIQRAISPSKENVFDPFLMLDEIFSDDAADYMAGFPEHPHRGFETVTYMLEGKMLHRDHMGNEGLLESGDVQWMTAGRGVLHSEMPQQEQGRMHGFQLWVNLPASLKMIPARYQEFKADKIPQVNFGSASSLKVISGAFDNGGKTITGPVEAKYVDGEYFDVSLAAGDTFRTKIKTTKKAFIYVIKGELELAGKDKMQSVHVKQTALLSQGDTLEIKAVKDAQFLLIAGEPIGEPMVQYGPIVMNTMEEVEQALRDYRAGRLV